MYNDYTCNYELNQQPQQIAPTNTSASPLFPPEKVLKTHSKQVNVTNLILLYLLYIFNLCLF